MRREQELGGFGFGTVFDAAPEPLDEDVVAPGPLGARVKTNGQGRQPVVKTYTFLPPAKTTVSGHLMPVRAKR